MIRLFKQKKLCYRPSCKGSLTYLRTETTPREVTKVYVCSKCGNKTAEVTTK